MDTTPGTFKDLPLSQDIQDQIAKVGFEHPTPIQEKAIPLALEGGDIIGCAQTGTGKTLAFCLPLMERLKGKKGTHALILCPTREIATQTHDVLVKFGSPLKITSVVLIGGRRLQTQKNDLQ